MASETTTLKETIRRLLPKAARAHRILGGPLRGTRIVTSWHDYPGALLGTTERSLLDWFAANVLDGETWIDVGAHYGYTAVALSRQVGVQGRVFAFEPVLSTAACISQTQRLNDFSQMTIVPLGLDASHNIRVVDLPAVRGMADSTIGHSHEHEKILVGSLDHLWPSLCNGDGRIHGVKIDVQGMEADVLKGMRQTLLRCAPKLVVEFHRGVDRFHVLDLLKECGYASTAEPIDQESAPDVLADDHSYAFFPLRAECAFLSTPSSIARS